jgi:hypothetical protein
MAERMKEAAVDLTHRRPYRFNSMPDSSPSLNSSLLGR